MEGVLSTRRQIGSAAFTSLYQGHPSAASGAVFKREWMRTYTGPLPSFQVIVQSWDTAFKTGKDNDYSVCTTWGKNNTGVHLLALWRGRVEFPQLKYQVTSQAQQWKPHSILLEDAASGQSLIQELRSATPYPVLAVKADRDKRSRAAAVTPMFEAGRVFLPADAPWLNDFVDELANFPNGVHDDMVDSTTQALNYLRQGPYGEPPPFVIDRHPGPLAQLQAALSAPPRPRYHDPRGFPEVRPILGEAAPQLHPRVGEKITSGQPLTPEEENHILFGDPLE